MNFPLKKQRSHYIGYFFILGISKRDETFLIGVYKDREIFHIGSFSEGLTEHEKQSLKETIIRNQIKQDSNNIYIEPHICVKIKFEKFEKQLINPKFISFQLKMMSNTCTWDKLILDNLDVKITHPDKIIWNDLQLIKEEYLVYLYNVSTYMLPFLNNRALTIKRFPHGVADDFFYQKNAPDYTPEFIKTKMVGDINYIVCNDLETLLWLGNQLALEYHIPFQTIERENPLEIVFDLDPPNRSHFPLAIEAAIEMKKIFDQFSIISFPKLSGNKGIQIHIPIQSLNVSYDDTKLFTSFIANYLVEHFPEKFTIERLKKHRGNKLYIDYVQFSEGKTIICPYSPRGTKEGTVAAPLFWDEVNHTLKVETFTIPYVLKRIDQHDCPFNNFSLVKNESVQRMIDSLKERNWVAT